MIEAIIRPVKLDEVTSALAEIGIEDFTQSAILCHGRQKGQAMVHRGAEYVSTLVEKVELEIIAADDLVGKVIEAIGNIAKTDRREDCRIYVLPFVEAS